MSLSSPGRVLAQSIVILGALTSIGAAQDLYGTACRGTHGYPGLGYTGRPAIGESFSVDLTNAPPGTPAVVLFGIKPTATPLDWIGAKGCELLVPLGSPSVGLVTNSRGAASVKLRVPRASRLINANLFNQWGIVDPGANPIGVTFSNGGRVIIGGPAPILTDRDTLDIRVEPGPGANLDWLSTDSPNFVTVPKMLASFATKTDDTELAITFSAEAYTSERTSRMFVRALIDGEVADPSDIVFTQGPFEGARSFAFTGRVDAGIHTVEIQWRRDPTGKPATAFMRTRSLEIRRSPTYERNGTLTTRTPESGKNQETTSQAWKTIDGTTTSFYSPPGATVTVGFSAETAVSVNGRRMFVRALIDGVPLSPSDVVFSMTRQLQARTMTFGAADLDEGQHTAEIQWLVDAGATATVGDRTVVVSAFPNLADRFHRFEAAPSGPQVTTNSGVYVPVPNLGSLIPLQRGDEISVKVSGEVHVDGGSEMWLRARVGNAVSDPVVLSRTAPHFGVQSFVFDQKDACEQTSLVGVTVEWRVSGGGTARFGDRTMALVVEPRAVPDLAEAPVIGLSNNGVEPVIGTRKVLTLLWDPSRPAHPAPLVNEVTEALYGAHGVSDYFEVNSGGRFTIQNEGVLGWFASQMPWQHYWNNHPDCDDPESDGYTGGHARSWAEAILAADAQVDFASYDTDQDGTLQPDELGILIVKPQTSDFGTVRDLDPYCSGEPFVVDGVIVPRIAEWYTSSPEFYFSTAAHELSHLLFELGDLYINGFNSNTEPGTLSLMADNGATSIHLDPMNKLALGWVTPCVVEADGWYQIDDVKHSNEVWILPREGSCDQEFFILENRQTSGDDPLYDEMLGNGNSGIVVWHIVLDPAQSDNPPVCMGQAAWDNNVTGNGRRGLRVVRPSVSYSSNGAWDASDYDLTSLGLVCPGRADARNVLRWADGTPSGYEILSWPASGPSMNVFIVVP